MLPNQLILPDISASQDGKSATEISGNGDGNGSDFLQDFKQSTLKQSSLLNQGSAPQADSDGQIKIDTNELDQGALLTSRYFLQGQGNADNQALVASILASSTKESLAKQDCQASNDVFNLNELNNSEQLTELLKQDGSVEELEVNGKDGELKENTIEAPKKSDNALQWLDTVLDIVNAPEPSLITEGELAEDAHTELSKQQVNELQALAQLFSESESSEVEVATGTSEETKDAKLNFSDQQTAKQLTLSVDGVATISSTATAIDINKVNSNFIKSNTVDTANGLAAQEKVLTKDTPVLNALSTSEKVVKFAIAPVVVENQLDSQAKSSQQSLLNDIAVSEQETIKAAIDNSHQANIKANAVSANELTGQRIDNGLFAGLNTTNNENNQINITDTINKLADISSTAVERQVMQQKAEQSQMVKSEVMIKEQVLFNKQEMANAMQQQVGMMLARNLKSVDIRLDPPELGSMQVRLSVNNEQAAIQFVVNNSQTKEALEASLPRLKELLEQQGMELTDSGVDHQQGNGEQNADSEHQSAGNSLSEQEQNEVVDVSHQVQSPWQVDYYA